MESKDKIKGNFGSRIQKLRLEQDISMRTLAARSGLEFSLIQRVESGKVNVELTTIHALATGLNMTVAELFAEGQ